MEDWIIDNFEMIAEALADAEKTDNQGICPFLYVQALKTLKAMGNQSKP